MADNFTAAETPDIIAETAELTLYLHKYFGIIDCGGFFKFKIIKRVAKSRALAKNCAPLKPRLKRLQNQKFKQLMIIKFGHAPFVVVIIFVKLRVFINPSAPLHIPLRYLGYTKRESSMLLNTSRKNLSAK